MQILNVSNPSQPPDIGEYDTGGSFSFSFPTESGTNYQVQYLDSLGQTGWNVLTNLAGTGVPLRVEDPAPPAGCRFYRVRQL